MPTCGLHLNIEAKSGLCDTSSKYIGTVHRNISAQELQKLIQAQGYVLFSLGPKQPVASS